jgi:RNA polymerase sigma-70 factor (ECF subfamily)
MTGTMGMTWPPELPFGLILERARALDQAALTLLFRRFLPVVYRYVLARVGNVQQAEDVTSETFLAVVEGISRSRAEDELGFSAWVLGIARNKVLHYFRRLRTHPEASLTAQSARAWLEASPPLAIADEADPLGVVTARESWAEVVVALHRLTEEQRDVVLYRCVLGHPTEDVARLLGKQPAAIRALQHRALTSLARHLGLAESPPDPARAPEPSARKAAAQEEERRTHAP